MPDISKIQLDSAVYNIKDEISRNAISNINQEISLLNSKRIVCVGDSYANGSGNDGIGWPQKLKNIMGLSNDNFYIFGESGGGFVKTGDNGLTFLTLLQNNLNNITNKETISHIIVCGGTNDAVTEDYTNLLQSAIDTFISYCNTQFPNAKIMIGFVGGNRRHNPSDYSMRERMYNKGVYYYSNAQRQKNVAYMNGLENIMKIATLYSDYIHANNEGYTDIAGGINSFINGGSFDFKRGTNINIPISVATNTNLTITEWFSNDILNIIKTNSQSIHFTEPITPSAREIALTAENTFANWNVFSIMTTIAYKTSSNTSWQNVSAKLFVTQNGQLKVAFLTPDNSNPSNVTDIYIYEFSKSCLSIENPFLI